MRDIFLEELKNVERWEKAINIGVEKGINKGELIKLCSPKVRAALYNAIANGKYKISPPHQAEIPKENGDMRIVYVNENIDRIFLSIVNDMLFEFCGEMVHSSCKSYQTGIGCGKIVQEVAKTITKIKDGDGGVKADLTKYFDTVKIEYIDDAFDKVEEIIGCKSKVIDVLRAYYHADWCFDVDGNLINHYQSLKQGCAVASFLSDVVLKHIDEILSRIPGYYVRYSDDLLYVGPYSGDVLEILAFELDKMKLTLNPKKVEMLSSNRWFKFLGFNIKGNQITLSKSRVKKFQKEIESRSIKCRDITAKKATTQINRYLYIGNGTYSWATQVLPIINVQKDIDELNKFVMDCIRACETGKKKIGGIGSSMSRPDYTITRGTGRNVSENERKTKKEIDGYLSIRCMQNAILTDRNAYETLIRCL